MSDRYNLHQPNDCPQLNYSFRSQGSSSGLPYCVLPIYIRPMEEARLPVRYFNNQNYNMNMKLTNGMLPPKPNGLGQNFPHSSTMNSGGAPPQMPPPYGGYGERNRFAPYYNNRASYAGSMNNVQYLQQYNMQFYGSCPTTSCYAPSELSEASISTSSSSNGSAGGYPGTTDQANQPVTLQINNLDYSLEENSLRHFLLNQLKPITPVVSLVIEGNSYVKVTVPNLHVSTNSL